MKRKNKLFVPLILLLIVSTTLVSVSPVSAKPDPKVSLNPLDYTAPAPGHNFTIDVTVTGVADLKGFEFKLWYNTSLLDATLVSPSEVTELATTWQPRDENHTFHWDAPPTINDTIGRVWIFGWGFPPFDGDGVLVTINFTATDVGNCILHINQTALYDHLFSQIPHETVDGSVTVIPEFPGFVVAPLLLIATLAAAFLGKMVWSRKRKTP